MVDCLLQAAEMLQRAELNEDRLVPQMSEQFLHSSNHVQMYNYPNQRNFSYPFPFSQQYQQSFHTQTQPQPSHQLGHSAVNNNVNRMPVPREYRTLTETKQHNKTYTTPKSKRGRQPLAQKKSATNNLPKLPKSTNATKSNTKSEKMQFKSSAGKKKSTTKSMKNSTVPSKPLSQPVTDDNNLSDESTDEESAGTDKMNKPRTNIAHNEVEKRRRAYLTNCYNDLHNILPMISGTKASNATVLRSAVDHIKALEIEHKLILAAKNEQLLLRQRILERQSRANKALNQRRMELQKSQCSAVSNHVPNYNTFENNGTLSEEEGVVPDQSSRVVNHNLSPKENLTLLGSPIKSSGKKKTLKSSRILSHPIHKHPTSAITEPNCWRHNGEWRGNTEIRDEKWHIKPNNTSGPYKSYTRGQDDFYVDA